MAGTRTDAQRLIAEGMVRVGDILNPKAATMVDPADPISIIGDTMPYVGRGGLKLDTALNTFLIEIAGRRAIDVGASTGGFTDCLLQRDVASVVAVDVGYGQLDWKLRSDERVEVWERTNIRHVDPADLGGPFDIVVCDVSFISLRILASQLALLGHENSDYVLLVKPQFELGKGRVGKGGVVKAPEERAEAIETALGALADHGVGGRDVVASDIVGAKGNQEFLVWCQKGPRTLTSAAIITVTTPTETA